MPPFFVCVCVCVCVYNCLQVFDEYALKSDQDDIKKKKVRPWACSLKRELELEYVMLLKKKRIRMFMLCIRPNGPLITFNLCQIWTHMEWDLLSNLC